MELSKRLKAVADLVTEGLAVADVGTDHGYIPIYLIESQKSRAVIAMDVNDGPLLRAAEHIAECQLERYIEVRKSDGLKELYPGEVDSVIMAGMGGALMIRIMEEGRGILDHLTEFILQPQSEVARVREYINSYDSVCLQGHEYRDRAKTCFQPNGHGFRIIDEDMVFEDGKYYPIMKVHPTGTSDVQRAWAENKVHPTGTSDAQRAWAENKVVKGGVQQYSPFELKYGKLLLERKHPVLRQYLERERITKRAILESLRSRVCEAHIKRRVCELMREIECIEKALEVYV